MRRRYIQTKSPKGRGDGGSADTRSAAHFNGSKKTNGVPANWKTPEDWMQCSGEVLQRRRRLFIEAMNEVMHEDGTLAEHEQLTEADLAERIQQMIDRTTAAVAKCPAENTPELQAALKKLFDADQFLKA